MDIREAAEVRVCSDQQGAAKRGKLKEGETGAHHLQAYFIPGGSDEEKTHHCETANQVGPSKNEWERGWELASLE
jgi:hypothetical protein